MSDAENFDAAVDGTIHDDETSDPPGSATGKKIVTRITYGRHRVEPLKSIKQLVSHSSCLCREMFDRIVDDTIEVFGCERPD